VAEYLVVAAIVFGLNLLPAFAPPTWTVLVYFRVSNRLAIAPLVLVGAVDGRFGPLPVGDPLPTPRFTPAVKRAWAARRKGQPPPPSTRRELRQEGTPTSR
jgi:hypothetical protein